MCGTASCFVLLGQDWTKIILLCIYVTFIDKFINVLAVCTSDYEEVGWWLSGC